MGAIQNVINQTLGTTATVLGASKHFQSQKLKAQEASIEAKSTALGLQAERIADVTGKTHFETEKEKAEALAAAENRIKATKDIEVATAAATKQSLAKAETGGLLKGMQASRSLKDVQKGQQELMSEYKKALASARLEYKAGEALKQVADIQNAQQSQKDRFMDWVKNLEVAGGGKVKDLPPNMQAQILAAYSEDKKGGNK